MIDFPKIINHYRLHTPAFPYEDFNDCGCTTGSNCIAARCSASESLTIEEYSFPNCNLSIEFVLFSSMPECLQ